jgi:hypothetical protein
MPAAGPAITTMAAGDMAFARHSVAEFEATHLLSHLDDFAYILVSHMHRYRNGLLRPLIPFPDMDISSTDRRLSYADHHIVMADRGLLHLSQG